MDFARRLRKLREKKGLTQAELGRLFNLSKQAISSYETGGSTPGPETLQRLADFFGVSVDWLLGRTDILRPPSQTSSHSSEKELEEEWPEVVNVLRRAGKKPTPEERRRIARIIKAAIEDTEEEEEEE